MPPTDTSTPEPLTNTPVPKLTDRPTHTGTPTEFPTLTLTPTPTPKPVAVVQAEALNVRGGPGTEYDTVGQAKQGDELEIVARTQGGDWLQVRLADGKEGWVSARLVEVSGEVTGSPVATVIPPIPKPVPPIDIPAPSTPPGMIYVPAGEFIMGSDDDEVGYTLQLCNRYANCEAEVIWSEQPQHRVYLDAFYIDKTEVPNAQYQQCVKAGVCQLPTTCDWGEPTYGNEYRAKHPVVCVRWHDANTYCEWAGARLPTEAEWEKAARGGIQIPNPQNPNELIDNPNPGRRYPWGNAFDGSKLNFCDANCPYDWRDASANDGYIYTAPVGSYPAEASPYGALDMPGNVWEWVADWYEAYPGSSVQSPYYGRQYRVIRGAAWYPYLWHARCAARYKLAPWHGNPDVGFRCARDSEQVNSLLPPAN